MIFSRSIHVAANGRISFFFFWLLRFFCLISPCQLRSTGHRWMCVLAKLKNWSRGIKSRQGPVWYTTKDSEIQPHQGEPALSPSSLASIFLATPGSIWDLSSLTRDWTCAPCSGKLRVLITGLPGKSLQLQFSNWFFSTFSVQFFFFYCVAAGRTFVVLCGIFPCCALTVVAGGRLSCSKACGVLVPRPGIKPVSPALEGRFLTTGPPGKSLCPV